MARFCIKCGAPLNGTAFCGNCGASVSEAPEAVQPGFTPVLPGAAPQANPQGWTPMNPQGNQPGNPPGNPQYGPQSGSQAGPQGWPSQSAPPGAAGMGAPTRTSPIVKLIIAAAIVFFIAGALVLGGIFYAARKVSHKLHQAAAGMAAYNGSGMGSGSGIRMSGDGCRLLSKEDVSEAIGVTIIRADSVEGGCSYVANGDQAEMTAKHMSAMMADNGASTEQQRQVQAFAGGLLKNLQAEDKAGEKNGSAGEVVVLSFSVDSNAADEQMRMNRGVIGGKRIPDLGVDAFQVGSSVIMLRKADKMVRIMYMSCPCNTDAVKPLARKLVAAI